VRAARGPKPVESSNWRRLFLFLQTRWRRLDSGMSSSKHPVFGYLRGRRRRRLRTRACCRWDSERLCQPGGIRRGDITSLVRVDYCRTSEGRQAWRRAERGPALTNGADLCILPPPALSRAFASSNLSSYRAEKALRALLLFKRASHTALKAFAGCRGSCWLRRRDAARVRLCILAALPRASPSSSISVGRDGALLNLAEERRSNA